MSSKLEDQWGVWITLPPETKTLTRLAKRAMANLRKVKSLRAVAVRRLSLGFCAAERRGRTPGADIEWTDDVEAGGADD